MKKREFLTTLSACILSISMVGCSLPATNTNDTNADQPEEPETVVLDETKTVEEEPEEIEETVEEDKAPDRIPEEPVYLCTSRTDETNWDWARSEKYEYNDEGRLTRITDYTDKTISDYDYESKNQFYALITETGLDDGKFVRMSGSNFDFRLKTGSGASLYELYDDGNAYDSREFLEVDDYHYPVKNFDEEGRVTSYLTNPFGRWDAMILKYDDNGNIIVKEEHMSIPYNDAAQALQAIEEDEEDSFLYSRNTYNYDENGDCVEEIQIEYVNGTKWGKYFTFEYDENHRIIYSTFSWLSVEDIDNEDFSVKEDAVEFTLTYNEDGLLASKQYNSIESRGPLHTYEYDEKGQRISESENGYVTNEYTYDENGNLIEVYYKKWNEKITFTYTETTYDLTYIDDFLGYTSNQIIDEYIFTGEEIDSWEYEGQYPE